MELPVTLLIAENITTAPLPESAKRQSADVLHTVADTFGINEVRELIFQAQQKGVTDAGRTFVVVVRSITTEAQNALLKLLEEPPAGARFYFVIPSEDRLLPTLRSRFVGVKRGTDSVVSEAVKQFMAAGYAERLDLIAKNTKEKNVDWIETVSTGVAHSLTPHQLIEAPQLAEAVQLVQNYIGIRGASRKQLLEELALALPVTE